jgi:hypothetical protein
LYKNGYAVINYVDLEMKPATDYSKNFPNNAVFYSQTYKMLKLSDFSVLNPILKKIELLENSDSSLIENYGAMGIISPRDGEFIKDETREVIQNQYNDNYGLKFGKWKIIIADRPLTFTQINLPIRELQISQKISDAILNLIAYFDIPSELHPLFSKNATYENKKHAEIALYDNVITKHSDTLLKILYDLAILNGVFTEFWYDFDIVYSLESRKYLNVQRVREEYAFWVSVIDNIKTTDKQKENAMIRINQLLEIL